MAAGAPNPGSVSSDTLNAKIAEIDAASDMGEEAKTKLLELYRKALSNLQASGSNAQAAEGFRQAAATAPGQVQAIREAMEKAAALPPEDSLDIDSSVASREIEQILQKEKADLAAVEAKRADREQHLEEEAGRPGLIRQRLIDAREQQEEVVAQLRLPKPSDEGLATAEARRWVLETRFDALSTEIKMLDEELLSQPARVGLLKAERDRAAASVQWVGTRVRLLEETVTNKRREEAAQAKAAAEATRREAEGEHSLVMRLAEQNASLAGELAQAAARMDKWAEQVATTDSLTRRIETDFKQVKDAIEVGGSPTRRRWSGGRPKQKRCAARQWRAAGRKSLPPRSRSQKSM